MKNKEFTFKENGMQFNINPQVAGEEIEKIKIKHGGKCKPEDIVSAARHLSNPLHTVFGWNDAEEANKHRLHIARILIGSIVVKFKHYEEVRANYSVKYTSVDDKENRAYVGVEEAVKPDYELQFTQEACNNLKAFIKRYQSFDYLQTAVKDAQVMINTLQSRIDELIEVEESILVEK